MHPASLSSITPTHATCGAGNTTCPRAARVVDMARDACRCPFWTYYGTNLMLVRHAFNASSPPNQWKVKCSHTAQPTRSRSHDMYLVNIMRDGTRVNSRARGTLYKPWHPTCSASSAAAGSGVNPSSSYVLVTTLMLSGYPADAMSNIPPPMVSRQLHQGIRLNRTRRKQPAMDH
jgi:hypothetical protein